MKRNYIRPEVKTVRMCPHKMIAASGLNQGFDNGNGTFENLEEGGANNRPSRYIWDDYSDEDEF